MVTVAYNDVLNELDRVSRFIRNLSLVRDVTGNLSVSCQEYFTCECLGLPLRRVAGLGLTVRYAVRAHTHNGLRQGFQNLPNERRAISGAITEMEALIKSEGA